MVAARTHGSKLNTPTFIAAMLITVASFSSWVLASINIRRITQGLGTYNPIDPSLVVLGVITFIYFLAILARGRSGAFKTSMVIGISTLLMLWYLANAIAYTVKRYSAPKYCQASVRSIAGLEGCEGLMKSLMAITWVTFALLALYILHLFLRAGKHAKLPWTNRESGMSVPVGRLTPGPTNAEKLAAEEAAARH